MSQTGARSLPALKKYWKQIRPILPAVSIVTAVVIVLGIVLICIAPGELQDKYNSLCLDIGTTLIGLGISIVIASFLLPTIIDMISMRRIRVVQERLLSQLEERLISWTICFCQLMKCPENLLRILHPAMYGLPDKPMSERLPRKLEPELKKWFISLRSAETEKYYANFKPQEWQIVTGNIGGCKETMEYFQQQLLPISTSLSQTSELSFKLIKFLNEPILFSPYLPFVANKSSLICSQISIIGESLLDMLNDTRELMGKTT